MSWLTIINTIVSYVWLIGSLWFLWRILLNLEKRNKPIATLAEVAMKDAESTRKAIETTQVLVEMLREKK